MFNFPEYIPSETDKQKYVPPAVSNKFKHLVQQPSAYNGETNYSAIEEMLEKEKQHNKTETWNKLDKTHKIQKLHAFAEKYVKEHGLPTKDIKPLKLFFVECLDKAKLQKAKDVVYEKETGEIKSIPALCFNTVSKSFTLKNLDGKRVSTLKSLTPKRSVDTPKVAAEDAAEDTTEDGPSNT